MRIQILDLAKADLVDGYRFYEEKEPGLGSYFIDSLFSDIDSLRLYAGIHRQAYKDLHRALSKHFPFAIYYSVEADIVRVRSVVDSRRNPRWIRRHLRGA